MYENPSPSNPCLSAASLRPFLVITKLVPMAIEEEIARASPMYLSECLCQQTPIGGLAPMEIPYLSSSMLNMFVPFVEPNAPQPSSHLNAHRGGLCRLPGGLRIVVPEFDAPRLSGSSNGRTCQSIVRSHRINKNNISDEVCRLVARTVLRE
jgi:hypothetical protein